MQLQENRLPDLMMQIEMSEKRDCYFTAPFYI